MANFKKSKSAVKGYIGSVKGDINSAFSKFTSKFGSVGGFSNTFDQRISDGLSDLLTGATGIRTSNIPEISADVLAMKIQNKNERANVLNQKGTRPEGTPGVKKTITFPEYFPTENGDSSTGLTNYIHFRSLPIRNGKNGAMAENQETLYDIFLYVPDEMTDEIGISFKVGEKTLMEKVIAKLMTLGDGTDQGLMSTIGQSTKEAIMGDIGKAAAGKVQNPMKFNLFEGVDMREFSYNFVLFPNKESDSEKIAEMAYAFKRSALPGIVPDTGNSIYTFPNEWAIRYHGPIKDWMDYPMVSVLSKVSVNHAPNTSARMSDGAPAAVGLSLTFKEVLGLDRKKYDQRVSSYINRDNNNREASQEGGTLDDIMGGRKVEGQEVQNYDRLTGRTGG
jgi:hypothetical protein